MPPSVPVDGHQTRAVHEYRARQGIWPMRLFNRLTIALAYLLFCMGGGAVYGGDGLTITVMNDTTDNLIVTIYDRNTSPPQKVLSSEVVLGSASIPVSISADPSGQGHLSWTARTA